MAYPSHPSPVETLGSQSAGDLAVVAEIGCCGSTGIVAVEPRRAKTGRGKRKRKRKRKRKSAEWRVWVGEWRFFFLLFFTSPTWLLFFASCLALGCASSR